MKIKAAGLAQKNQASQGITEALAPSGDTETNFSLRQEFQAALENFTGRGFAKSASSPLDFATLETPILPAPNPRSLQRGARQEGTAERPETRNASARELDGYREEGPSEDSPRSGDERSAQDSSERLSASQTTDVVATPSTTSNDQAVEHAVVPVSTATAGLASTQQAGTSAATVPEDGGVPATAPNALTAAPGDSGVDSHAHADRKAQYSSVGSQNASGTAAQPIETSATEAVQPSVAVKPNANVSAAVVDNKSALNIAAPQTNAALAAFTAAMAAAVAQQITGTGGSTESTNQQGGGSALNKGLGIKSLQGAQSTLNTPADGNAKAELARNSEQVMRSVRFQPSRILERVESTLKEAARSRDGKTISFRLDPPELGSLKVDVSIRDGALHARISADSPQVAGLLRERAYELQSMLRKLGLAVEKVSISVHESATHLAGEFSQSFSNSGNSSSSQHEKSKEFNTFGSGAGFASTTSGDVSPAVSPRVEVSGVINGWVA